MKSMTGCDSGSPVSPPLGATDITPVMDMLVLASPRCVPAIDLLHSTDGTAVWRTAAQWGARYAADRSWRANGCNETTAQCAT